MDGETNNVNPWIRANLDSYCDETLALIPSGLHEEYRRLMKQLAHARGVANLALESLHIWEEERRDFFDFVIQATQLGGPIETTPSENKGVASSAVLEKQPYCTTDETGYPPNVIDFAKYLSECNPPPEAA